MKTRNKTLLAVLAAVGIGVLLLATALFTGNAEKKKDEYIKQSQMLAIKDLSDALSHLGEAVESADLFAINREAGKAEAYLSRSGLEGCGGVYAILNGICRGEYGIETVDALIRAARSAIDGDGGKELRSLTGSDEPDLAAEETTEDPLSSRVLERLGQGKDDVAVKRATAFACPNAAFDECMTDIPDCFRFSGGNVFVSVEGKSSRVTMYCFDRELDERYSVSRDNAARTVEMIVKKEKLRLTGDPEMTADGGVYRFVYRDEETKNPLVIFEVYSDTGRLRMYNAVNYYK